MSWPDYNSWNYAPMYSALSQAPGMLPQYPAAQTNPYYCNYGLGSQVRLTSVHNQPPPGNARCIANQHVQYPYSFPANAYSGQTTQHLHRPNSHALGCNVQKDRNSEKSENTDNGGIEISASTANEMSLNKIDTAELATTAGLEINPGVKTFTDSYGRTWVCESDRAIRGERTVSSKETNATQRVTSVSNTDTFRAEISAVLSARQPAERKPNLNSNKKTDASEESPATKISSSIFKETKMLIRKVLTTNDIPTLLVIENMTKITNKVISSIGNTKKRGISTPLSTEELINVTNKIISFVMTLLNAMQNTGGDVAISTSGERSLDEQFPAVNRNPTLSTVNHVAGMQSRDKLQSDEVPAGCQETAQILLSNHRGKHSNESECAPSNSEPVDANKWNRATCYRLCPAFAAQCRKVTAGKGKGCECSNNTHCLGESEPTDVAQSVDKVISAMTWTPIITDEMNGETEYPATTVHKTDGRHMYPQRSDYVYSAENSSRENNDTSNELKKTLTFNHSPESKFQNYSSYSNEHHAKSKIKPILVMSTDYNKQNCTPHPVGLLTTKNACSKTHFHTSKCCDSVHTDYQNLEHPATEQYPSPLNSEEQHCCAGTRTKHKCMRKTCSRIQHCDCYAPCAHKTVARLAHESSFDRLSRVGSAMVPLRRMTHNRCAMPTRPTVATTNDFLCKHGANVEHCSCHEPSNVDSLKLITIFPRDKYIGSEASEANEDCEEDMKSIRSVFKNVQTTMTNNDTRESD